MDVFDAPVRRTEVELIEGQCFVIERFLDNTAADHYFMELCDQIEWQQPLVRVFGKWHPTPRLTAWYGDSEAIYSYSGVTHSPQAWIAPLIDLKLRIEKEVGSDFNSVLLNSYRTGEDSMGRHSDDEPELGPHPVIASLSLGGPRRFVFKHRFNKTIPAVSVSLGHGALLVMSGPTQDFWWHSLPKTRKRVSPRINLTYRKIRSAPLK